MLSIFSLEDYKNYLISFYYYECDNNIVSREKRRTILETHYTDEFLSDIIHNTESFIMYFLEQVINREENYISFELFNDQRHIFTNCTGGYSPDYLIPISCGLEDKYISKYLLQKYLGSNFRIDFDDDIEEILDDVDEDIVIGGIYCTPKMIITGNFSSLQEKYDALKKQKQEELVRVLRKRLEHE